MLEKIVTVPNAILSLAVWAILIAIRKARPSSAGHRGYQRLLPVLPPLLGVLGALVGVSSGTSLAEKIAIGIVFGTVAGQGFKIGRTSILGLGLPPKPAKEPPASSHPAPPAPPKG